MFDSLLLTVWTLSNQETFREVGDRFGLSEGHTYRVFIKICRLLTSLEKRYIVWPQEDEALQNLQNFNVLRGDTSFPSK